MSSTVAILESPTGPDRRVPTWAAGLVAGLSRDMPTVVTRDDLAERLVEVGVDRTVDSAVHELRRLGWLVTLPVHGVWAFVPPGVGELLDPYIGLRAWRARDPDAGFMLCGATAAWHLGYLDRDTGSPVSVWIPSSTRLPDGLRPHVSIVRFEWAAKSLKTLAPSSKFLIDRKLDLLRWASALPAFGPEALVAQLAIRPSSFAPWVDLVAHLARLVYDCDDDRLAALLNGQPTAAWQRAAYLLHAGGESERGMSLFDGCSNKAKPKTRFAHPAIDTADPVWIAEYNLIDALVAPLQAVIGKA
jgi:AbiEi antitoxin C-terminal domain